jgi:hypothetical protein
MDETLCLRPAVATINEYSERWYCANHYDEWIAYYRMAFFEYGNDNAGRILKVNR